MSYSIYKIQSKAKVKVKLYKRLLRKLQKFKVKLMLEKDEKYCFKQNGLENIVLSRRLK